MNNYNNYSQKLLEKSGYRKLKKGETVEFELLSIRYDKKIERTVACGPRTIPNTARIWDPNLGENGDFVDIAYIVGDKPAGVNSMKETKAILGTITFERSNVGKISITAGSSESDALYKFLCLSPYREGSDSGKEAIYKMLEPAKAAKDKVSANKKISEAKRMVYEMTDKELETAANGMNMQFMTTDDIILKLEKLAETQPEKIMNLSQDYHIKNVALVKEAEEAKIITYDTPNKVWKWMDTQDKICVVPPGKIKTDTLADYFLEEDGGVATKKAIEKALKSLKGEK